MVSRMVLNCNINMVRLGTKAKKMINYFVPSQFVASLDLNCKKIVNSDCKLKIYITKNVYIEKHICTVDLISSILS